MVTHRSKKKNRVIVRRYISICKSYVAKTLERKVGGKWFSHHPHSLKCVMQNVPCSNSLPVHIHGNINDEELVSSKCSKFGQKQTQN